MSSCYEYDVAEWAAPEQLPYVAAGFLSNDGGGIVGT